MEDKAQVIITAQHIKLKMESLALFDSGSAELKADSFALLDEMVRHLSQMGNQIIAEGHTDNIPIHNQLFNSNWELSAARSFSVVYYFLNKGIAPDRLIAHGLGEFRPAFSNDVETERAKNRRIEITIVRGGAKG
jgi:chemotaxis protein MotB